MVLQASQFGLHSIQLYMLFLPTNKANADQVLHNFEAKLCREHCTNVQAGDIQYWFSSQYTQSQKVCIVLLVYLCGFQRLH
jgi:hypothetical protein